MARKTGPKPKPTKLRLLHGDQPKRINRHEPVPPEGEVAAPGDMTDRGRDCWDELHPMLAPMGLVTVVDVPAFAMMCETLALFRSSATVVNTSPVLVESATGALVKNPAILPMMQSARAASLLMAEFGMTPSARSRLTDPRRLADDERDRLLS